MFWNIFGRRPQYADVRGDGAQIQRKNRMLVVVIIGAICVLAFGGIGGKGAREENVEKQTDSDFDIAAYTMKTEERLTNVLEKISGAGNVEVMVVFDSAYEKVLAKNSKNELAADVDGEKNSNTSGREETVMLYGSGSDEKPYVLKEKMPDMSGVLVVASGAGNESVRLEIYEAVKALYGISGHRIKVSASASQ